MKYLKNLVGFTIIGLFFFTACKKTPDNYLSQTGKDYYPLEVGKFIEYEMDSTIYDPNGDSMVFSTKTFVREEVVDTLHDNNDSVLFKIEHYERVADTLPWTIKKVLSQTVLNNQAIRTEDNLRFIKMTFPLRKGKRWDGNIFFNEDLIVTIAGETLEMFKGWSYRVNEVNQPFSIGNFQFDETATVEEAENENLIELRRSKSVYAKSIGLVYRELWILDTQCIDDCIGKLWEEKAQKGFILKQTIINHN